MAANMKTLPSRATTARPPRRWRGSGAGRHAVQSVAFPSAGPDSRPNLHPFPITFGHSVRLSLRSQARKPAASRPPTGSPSAIDQKSARRKEVHVTTAPQGLSLYLRPEPNLLGQRQFRAMNTNVQLYVRDLENVSYLPAAEELFHAMEARLSRFLPDSELCQMNNRAGEEIVVSDTLFDILAWAIALNRVTHGVFDPAVLPDLEAAGYDKSFEQIERESHTAPDASPAAASSISQLRLAASRVTAQAPAGLRIDLGGIGKGYSVDAASRLLEPAADFVVNAGGDIFASGSGADGDGWLVSLTDPRDAERSVGLVRLHDEALATSTTALRRWKRGDQVQHHLIDPRTRRPAESGVLSASVVARTATEADVFAKTALVLGLEEGGRFLDEQGAVGFFVLEDGTCRQTDGWSATAAQA